MELIVGGVIITLALALIVALTIWSRRMINKLAAKDFPSARDARLEMHDE